MASSSVRAFLSLIDNFGYLESKDSIGHFIVIFSDVYFCDVPNNYWCPMGMLKNKGFNGVIVKSATDKFNEMKKK